MVRQQLLIIVYFFNFLSLDVQAMTSGSYPEQFLFQALDQRRYDDIPSLLAQYTQLDINKVDHTGKTPLFQAVIQKHKPTVALLLSTGADPNIAHTTYHQTPLQAAANIETGLFQGSIAEMLLHYGADKDAVETIMTVRGTFKRTAATVAQPQDIKRGILAYQSLSYVLK